MGELRPLAEDLDADCRAFAEALRTLFDGLGVSVRRYAARRFRDPGTISRYLGGTRVPPWEFVVDLFDDLTEQYGSAPTPLALDHVHELHRSAVRAGGSPGHGVQVLQQQLAVADREAWQASMQEEVLGEALLDRQHRIADLEARLGVLEAQRAAGGGVLQAQRQDLVEQVLHVEGELEQARMRVMLAESRCGLLERQLAVAESAAAGRSMSAQPREGRARVLIVDDQPANLVALEAVLAALGHEVVKASSGSETLKILLNTDGFAVILLDVQMPEMDGYETAAYIKRRARTRNTPIIFLTAMDRDPAYEARGYTVGAVDYIVKPFDPWVIRAKVEVFAQMYLDRAAGGSKPMAVVEN
jgi:CheY-like chemotaxis protein